MFFFFRNSYLCSPLQPQLEDVVVAAALDHLVTGVVLDVVQLVRHEQILGRHLITADQQTLTTHGQSYILIHGYLHTTVSFMYVVYFLSYT